MFYLITKSTTLGNIPSIQYEWYDKNNILVAKFNVWDWWDGKNISDFEINKKYQNLGLSYKFLNYAIQFCGVKNLAVEKNNPKAKHIYFKTGFKINSEDDKYYYMSLI